MGWAFLPFSQKLRINREARVFDQMTSDQASGGLKHEYYHLQDLHDDPFQMTRPIEHTQNEKNEESMQDTLLRRRGFLIYIYHACRQ